MNKNLFYILVSIPFFSHAGNYGCATVGASMELELFDALTQDLHITPNSIQQEKTTVEVLGTYPISILLAKQLAHIDYESETKSTGKALLSEQDYYSSFHDNGVKSITAKYTYVNNENKRNVFIATSLMNNDECSIRFNGYLTLSREF